MNEKQFEEKLTLLDELQSACTHCGLCSEGCATFQATGWEHESPRGRIHLATQFLHGRIQPNSTVLSTFDRCLGCQACELLCPQNVSYHQVRQIVQELRRELKVSIPSVMERHQYKQWIRLFRRISNPWWRRYGAKWLSIPTLDCHSKGSFAQKYQRQESNPSVLAVCCLQDLFQHEVIEQTISFMQRLGYPLRVDHKQPCCGALFERLVHGGEETISYPKEQQRAAVLQDQASHAFQKWMAPHTYFLSRGCQCFYGEGGDLYGWIENVLEQRRLMLYLPQPQEVYYQPYCRSQKGMQDSIWRLLQQIEGLIVREVMTPQACCGGYCGETLLHEQHAQALASQKMAHLPDQATLIVTSSDCWSLFKKQDKRKNLKVIYPVQLLMQAHIKTHTRA
jgi:glycolate oxidase iron-sulfur subunit